MNGLSLILSCLLCTTVIATGSTPPVKAPELDPTTATLAQAVGDWVDLLEVDDARAAQRAAERWAGDKEAAKDLQRLWPELQDRHAKFDYRTWIKGGKDRPASAEEIGDADTFTVGGHAFGHLHTRWVKTSEGWRITRVFVCR